jgi:cell division protein FtsQ
MTTTQTPTETPSKKSRTKHGTKTGAQSRPKVRINPRIRERRIEVQREAGRRRLRVLLVVSCVLSVAGLTFLAVTSPMLDVDRIRIAGAHHMTDAEVRSASGVHVHDHLLFVDTGAVARRVERLPWVAKASVKRDLPGTLQVTIREYVPIAFVRVPDGVMLVAGNGHVIGHADTPPPGGIEIKGVRQAPGVGDLLSPPDAAGIVAHLPVALATQVVAVDVSGNGLALVLASGQIRLGNSTQLDAKAASALAVLAHLDTKPFTYIDVSTPARPVSHS